VSLPSAVRLRALMPSNDTQEILSNVRRLLEAEARRDRGEIMLSALIGDRINDLSFAREAARRFSERGYTVIRDGDDAIIRWGVDSDG
jgi:hypothetical protein